MRFSSKMLFFVFLASITIPMFATNETILDDLSYRDLRKALLQKDCYNDKALTTAIQKSIATEKEKEALWALFLYQKMSTSQEKQTKIEVLTLRIDPFLLKIKYCPQKPEDRAVEAAIFLFGAAFHKKDPQKPWEKPEPPKLLQDDVIAVWRDSEILNKMVRNYLNAAKAHFKYLPKKLKIRSFRLLKKQMNFEDQLRMTPGNINYIVFKAHLDWVAQFYNELAITAGLEKKSEPVKSEKTTTGQLPFHRATESP